MSTLSANTLFHFTRTRETLINILKTRFYPRLSLEENFFFSKMGDKIAYPMVCFCDIPLSQIKNHTNSYGKYAIFFLIFLPVKCPTFHSARYHKICYGKSKFKRGPQYDLRYHHSNT